MEAVGVVVPVVVVVVVVVVTDASRAICNLQSAMIPRHVTRGPAGIQIVSEGVAWLQTSTGLALVQWCLELASKSTTAILKVLSQSLWQDTL